MTHFGVDKFHALTKRVFDNILYGDQYAAFPYDPNVKEVDIIKHFETAAFILGRSGTGKTTCLLYKLLSRHIASRVDATEDKEHCQVRLFILTENNGLRSDCITRSL